MGIYTAWKWQCPQNVSVVAQLRSIPIKRQWASFGEGQGELLAMEAGDKISDPDPPPPPPPTHTHLLGLNKNHIIQYLFAFYGNLRWTYPEHMISLSTSIQIFWACTVYKGWEETEIRDTTTLIIIFKSDSIQCTPPPPPPPHAPTPAWLRALGTRIKYFYISIVHHPTFSLHMTPM